MRRDYYKTSTVYNLNSSINLISYYLVVVLVLVLILCFIFCSYNETFNYSLYVDGDYKLIVDDNFFPIKYKYLYIEHKKYSYDVLNISEPYLLNNKKYYEILINIDLSNYNDKNIMTITIVKEKTTIFNKLIKKLKGW